MSEIEDRKLNYKHDQPFQEIFSGYVAPAGEMKTESHSVDVGTAELKLACPLPITNPPSTAVCTHTTLNWNVKILVEYSNKIYLESAVK